MPGFPRSLQRFVELFNHEAFWESHEVLEAPWRKAHSGFYKGLILLASAWVHVQRGNARGIEAQLRKSLRQLGPYRPAYLGVDVDAVLAHAEAALADVARHRGAEGHRWESLLPPPRLALEPERLRGDEPELDRG
jgi:uncharacterized protein